jgi:hypothetical protein
MQKKIGNLSLKTLQIEEAGKFFSKENVGNVSYALKYLYESRPSPVLYLHA